MELRRKVWRKEQVEERARRVGVLRRVGWEEEWGR